MIKSGIMSGSVRSGPSSPGRAILSQDAVFSVDASADNRDWGIGAKWPLALSKRIPHPHSV
jgi:hypothetical protein